MGVNRYARITTSTTTQVKARGGVLHRIIVDAVGTGWTITVYDDPAANNNPVWSWATADGKANQELGLFLANGIRVVTAGTAGSCTVVYE